MEGGEAVGWAMNEFSELDLGDKRLSNRLIQLCESFSESPESPINQACADWAETKAAYRFFQNDKADASKIMKAHALKTAKRAKEHGTVLALQDTSYLIYTSHQATTGLGKLTVLKGKNVYKFESQGLLMHSCLAVTTEGLPLGLLDQQIFARKTVTPSSKQVGNTTPIEEKESFRWLESLRASKQLLRDTQVVTVCDREADIYEFLQLSTRLEAPVLLRAKTDRPVNKRSMYQEGEIVTLWKRLKQEVSAGTFTVEVPVRKPGKHTKARDARTAELEIRFCSFNLNPPKRLSIQTPDLKMSAVCVSEKHCPTGVEPIEWMLLTNLEVNDIEQAFEKVKWYTLRWRIEMFFKVLKSGFNVEKCRLSDAQRLIRYLTLMSIIAWRLFMITIIARTDPELPCDQILSENEWKVLYLRVHKKKTLPTKIPKIAEAVVWIARLGGFLARKNDGQAGTLTLWRGWKRLADLTDGYLLNQEI